MNPFVYGEAVAGEFFTNREAEIRDLSSELKSGQNIIIFSPRRYGKTSLIKKVLNNLKKEGCLTLYIDLFFVNSKQKFVEIYAEAIAKTFKGPFVKIIEGLRSLLPKLLPKIVVRTGGETSFEFEFDRSKKIAPLLEDLYESVNKLARKHKKKAIVVFDEFQELLSFDDGEIESGMRSKFQFHRDVAYVFLGSKRNLMRKLFDDKSRSFYNSGRKYPLPKIETAVFSRFIKERMHQTGVDVKQAEINQILEISRCHPYYTQELCHFVWEKSRDKKKVSKELIDEAVQEIILSEAANYNSIWENLTAKQKGYLMGLSEYSKISAYSREFLEKNQLGTQSTVQKLTKILYDKQLIEKEGGKVFFEDIFFEKWIQKHVLAK
ncbi:ATP-binding protein [Candidatus Saganbacteria bacterium]|nr:ATP-binding protein [Candidatus Saganbacteria bacterium]